MRKYIIAILIVGLLTSIGIYQVNSKLVHNQNIINEVKLENQEVNETIQEPKEPKPEPEYITMQATAYDLSIQCCGKSYNNPSRGISRDGYDLNNKSHKEAYTVASNRFPMGTKLHLEFPESHKQYDGVYTVRDTGNFKENILDVYVGDFGENVHQDTINFGRVDIKVVVIN
jgi:3D (Asp-Asp-Asp) domain-containing protein